MANLKMDLLTHRVVLENNNLALSSGIDDIAQDVQTRLKTFLGEWYLDTRIGVPYYSRILGQKPQIGLIKGVFRDTIMTTPGIIRITQLDLTYEGATRGVIVRFKADTTAGPLNYNRELII